MYDLLLVKIIGIISGLIAGALGTATAPTILMGLLMFKLVPNFGTAAGTTLLTILPPLSLFAVYEYYKKKQINFKYAIILMITCTIFEWIGAKFNHLLEDSTLKRILAIYLYIVGTYMLYQSFN